MKRMIAVLMMAAACGQQQGGASASANALNPTRDEVQQAALEAGNDPALPPVTRLAEWRDRSFFGGTADAFSIQTHAPNLRYPIWVAYGVDTAQQQVVFRIALVGTDELASFNQRLKAELVRATVSNPDSSAHYGDMGQLQLPPPPPPPDGPNGEPPPAGWMVSKLLNFANLVDRGLGQFNAPTGVIGQ